MESRKAKDHCNIMMPREQWEGVFSLSCDLPNIANDVGIERSCLVFIGGLACYFHLFKTFGLEPQNWRGTVDIDLVLFGKGTTQRLIAGLRKADGITSVSTQRSHLEDKFRSSVLRKSSPYPVEIDLYGELDRREGVFLNGIRILPDKIVNQPPISISNKDGSNPVYVPDIIDTLLLKWDVLTGADEFRQKDTCDLIGCLAVTEAEGLRASEICRAISNHIFGPEIRRKTRDNLKKLVDRCRGAREEGLVPSTMRLPSKEYLRSLTQAASL